MERAILQLALDFINLHRAIKVAKEALKGGVDWLEAGTPLIKSEGLNSVRELKKNFPGVPIVADMKTLDTGAVEVEAAAKAGADVVIIMGLADDSTIKEAIEAARRVGAKIMIDLMNVDDMIGRAVEVERLGVDYICVHVGIDQQMRGMKPLDVLKQVVDVVRIPVAVAGGINSETAAQAVEAGASIVIVGGAITKAENAEEAARTIKQAMLTRKPIATTLYKKFTESELIEAFKKVSTPNIADAMHRRGAMKGLIPITLGVKMVGKAVTVRAYPGDWSKPIQAIDVAEPGSVIVIDAGGAEEAVWGELASWSCVVKGIAGVVIDGAIRDVDIIRELKFPAFARWINPRAGEPKGFGEINVEITCGGVIVRPGDWVIGDDNGVVVVPKEIAVEVANRSIDVMEKENRIREEIKRGSTLSKVLELKKWEKVIG
ncbi:MAG: orotidine 5'-phosphate decarboxylase [Candidatus Nezhaarchaeota archaeon]|nr:orotidine 5'-phosphate decarboxylase [Candidatus Nezhaarchaeota archaeon]MCX8142400.1 orotidine 5'-phosphate decarboxylase [Candidatus Nezhaarchaeota archaeon]MDW8050627.1 3-hexulose-6-phosphate synthase [Nitrososphaerota archaeon]